MGNLTLPASLNQHVFGLNFRDGDRKSGFHSEVLINKKQQVRAKKFGKKSLASESSERLPIVHWKTTPRSDQFYFCLWSHDVRATEAVKFSSMFPSVWTKEQVTEAISAAVREWNAVPNEKAGDRKGALDWKGCTKLRHATIWIAGYASRQVVDTAFPVLGTAPQWVHEGAQGNQWNPVSESAKRLRSQGQGE